VRGRTRERDSAATAFSRRLRRVATDAERKLWSRLRNRQIAGFKFVRQHPIGPYTADFCCREVKLVIEVDGGQHADSKRDIRRDTWLADEGYRVLRFSNVDALTDTEGVLEAIRAALPVGSQASEDH
jgi:very-short-patch-repair endonuclease